jgi:hypothetical protein
VGRPQEVVVPILRADPRLDGVTITTWVPDIDFRDFPLLNIRRLGGGRSDRNPALAYQAVIEMTMFSTKDLIQCEALYETALDVLYDAVKYQAVTAAGSLQSIFEIMGATQFSSMFQDSWRVQGLIRLSISKPRIY